MIVLGVATLALSSYGLFELAHVYGGVPVVFALLVVGGFDVFAIAAGGHAMAIARDGDSAGPWNLAVVGAAVLSAVLQYMHTVLAGQPWPIGVMMAVFPLATVSLFEGTLRRAHRLNGRETGRVAPPRASFELIQWLIFPRATFRAFRLGVADRSLGGDAAFKLGLIAQETERGARTYAEPPRRTIDLSYDRIIPGYPQYVAGPSGTSPELESGQAGQSDGTGPDKRSVKALVEENMQVTGMDDESVFEAVRSARPDVKEDSIRKAIRTARTLRSA
jgi:hypothetical protein